METVLGLVPIGELFGLIIITLDQWFLNFISLPNPYVILPWFEKIFLFFIVLDLFYLSCWTLPWFSSLSFFCLLALFYRPLTFFFWSLSFFFRSSTSFLPIILSLVDLTWRELYKGGATFGF